jgi:phosphoribosylglycinamide formyltransferase-1
MQRVVILISGRGTNMQAIVQACRQEGWPAQIAAVVSNRPDAAGLAWAQAQGIDTAVVDHRAHPSREAFDAALQTVLDGFQPDLVVLAGFMRILTPAFVNHYAGRMLNIHPSLLPAFPGLHTHQRAIDSGCTVAGATVHVVTADLDHGPIVAQAVVPVRADDSAATLADRVLAHELRLYPLAVGWWVRGELAVDGARVRHRGGVAQCLFGAAPDNGA